MTDPLVADPSAGFPLPSPPAATEGGSQVAPPAPPRRERRREVRRVKARQVQRVVTRIDPMSMFRMAMAFALCLWLIIVVAGIVIWQVAVMTGTIGKIENFLAQLLAEQSFTINGLTMLEGAAASGLILFVTGALLSVVTSVLFNLVATVFGGLRFTVVELETARPVDGV